QILLVRDAVLIDDEGHHARGVVVHRPGHPAAGAGHLVVHHVIGGAALGGLALPFQDAEVVAVERRRSLLVRGPVVTLLAGLGDQDAEGAARPAAPRRPVEAVLLPRGAAEPASVKAGALAVVPGGGVG